MRKFKGKEPQSSPSEMKESREYRTLRFSAWKTALSLHFSQFKILTLCFRDRDTLVSRESSSKNTKWNLGSLRPGPTVSWPPAGLHQADLRLFFFFLLTLFTYLFVCLFCLTPTSIPSWTQTARGEGQDHWNLLFYKNYAHSRGGEKEKIIQR